MSWLPLALFTALLFGLQNAFARAATKGVSDELGTIVLEGVAALVVRLPAGERHSGPLLLDDDAFVPSRRWRREHALDGGVGSPYGLPSSRAPNAVRPKAIT